MSRFISVVIALAVCFVATASASGTSYVSRLLDTGGWNYSYARDINNSGQIVGDVQNEGSGNAVIWNSYTSSPQLINTGEGDRESLGYTINNSGTVTGYHTTSEGNVVMFQWSSVNGITPGSSFFPYDGTIAGNVYDVNDADYVVGFSVPDSSNPGETHASLWHGENTVDIGTFGGTWSAAEAINNANLVAGVYGGDNGAIGNFQWSLDGETTFIPANSSLDSGGLFGVVGINDNGVVLGNAEINGVDTVITWSDSDGYTIVGNGIAYAINNSNTIVGVTNEGTAQAVVWTPQVPEPSSILALLCSIGGLAGMLTITKRRREV
ncbi:MAG: PEP-CTERM sorting domain-containing protein [Armatimonadota bacterium]